MDTGLLPGSSVSGSEFLPVSRRSDSVHEFCVSGVSLTGDWARWLRGQVRAANDGSGSQGGDGSEGNVGSHVRG
jgi:hypothetical protein